MLKKVLHGKRLAEQRINEIQMGLNKIEYALQDLAANNAYSDRQGIYQRVIRNRRFRISEYTGGPENIKNLEKEFADLYSQAQKENLAPIFPAGFLLQYSNGNIRCFLFCEITNYRSDNKHILDIPQGEYLCLQADLQTIHLIDTVEQHFSALNEKTVIVINLMLDKYNINSRKSELQVANTILI